MEIQETSVEIFEKCTWKIENFSRLNVDKIYSERFILGGYPWTILLFPKGNKSGKDNSLSIYLDAEETAIMSEGCSRDVKFKLVVFNQLNTDRTITEETNHKFNAKESNWGYTSFMTLTELHDPEKGFIVKEACIVGVEVFICKSTLEKLVNQEVKLSISLTVDCHAGHMEVEIPRPEPEGTNLEILSPVSKVICNEPTKQADDAELVSAALGRVLYFLKTKKVRDMNEQACKDLQALWEELKKFNKFDVTWLEPIVQSSLAMRSYVENALEAEKLTENMVVLELEMERLNTKLVAVEVNLDVERDMLKAKGFKEINLDSELGCGSWKP